MSSIISGDGRNVTTPVTGAVAGAANNGSGLIRITTSAAHHFATGDNVLIQSVGGTTEANGRWTITVTDATHFDLIGSAFVHAYTSGGTVLNASLTPPFTVPSDGENATMNEVLTWIEALADRTQYLRSVLGYPFSGSSSIATPQPLTNRGTYVLGDVIDQFHDDTTNATNNTWVGDTAFTTAHTWNLLNQYTGLQANDILDIDLQFNWSLATTVNCVMLDHAYQMQYAVGAGSFLAIPGMFTSPLWGTNVSLASSFFLNGAGHMHGRLVWNGTSAMTLGLAARATSSAGVITQLTQGSWYLRVTRWAWHA
jgi:hypothetical protein